jgi:hypothetical protein
VSTDFFVHIVDSFSPDELLDGETPGQTLREFLKLSQIPYWYSLVVDRRRLGTALGPRLNAAIACLQKLPILHLDFHGGESGIQLTDQRDPGEVVPWNELGQILLPIHQAMPGGLGVCMSCCKGGYGQAMARTFDRRQVPFTWLFGPASDVDRRDLALAFAVFYRRYQAGVVGQNLVDAVQSASGIYDFLVADGRITQMAYTREVLQHAMEELGRKLQQPTAPTWQPPFFGRTV